MAKNRELTEKKILDAVQKVLIDEGATNLGVNSIARKAGVSKVLIYRYFESYENLIYKYININNPFPLLKENTIEFIKLNDPKIPEVVNFFFSSLIDYIFDNPGFKEILIWELAFSNEITKEIARRREDSAQEIISFMKSKFPDNIDSNFNGITSIITGGIFYLVSRSKTVDSFSGINIKEDKKVLQESVKSMIFQLFA